MATTIIHTLFSESVSSQEKGKTVLKVLQEQEDQDRNIIKLLDRKNKGYIDKKQFIRELVRLGIDYRRPDIKAELDLWIPPEEDKIDYETFLNLMRCHDQLRESVNRLRSKSILYKSFSGKLAIPDWSTFCHIISCLFDDIKANIHEGELPSYIPLLAKVDPNVFGISICTVDGQIFEYGESMHDFTMQSCSSPLIYLLALQQHGTEVVCL